MAAFNKNFIVKNGIEVGTGLIFGDNISKKVGIGTTSPATDIDLYGTTSVDNLIISGTVSAANTVGKSNQYLRSTGVGVTWTDFPNLRSGFTTTAQGNQTVFASAGFTYTPGLIDVYVNGTRLRGNGLSDISEFNATNGTSITLENPCFGGETVDVFGYSGIAGGLTDSITSGIVTATGGFISVGNTTPIQISLIGNQLTFTAVGIGSTTLSLV